MAVFEVRDCCPECGSKNFKKNGHIHNGKQNHKCKDCERQFVMVVEKKTITEEDKELIDKLLLERISLQGICRVTNISMTWLLIYIENLYDSLPDHLNFHIIEEISPNLIIQQLEVDEMWSFVEKKANKQWIWIAMDPVSKQVIAFHVGDRSRDSAKALWEKIPKEYQDNATFYTDQYEAYVDVIPKERHNRLGKKFGKTNHIERLNCTVRQRVSRLVRKALSFSKKLDNHIGAIKYFFCNYNLVQAALLV